MDGSIDERTQVDLASGQLANGSSRSRAPTDPQLVYFGCKRAFPVEVAQIWSIVASSQTPAEMLTYGLAEKYCPRLKSESPLNGW